MQDIGTSGNFQGSKKDFSTLNPREKAAAQKTTDNLTQNYVNAVRSNDKSASSLLSKLQNYSTKFDTDVNYNKVTPYTGGSSGLTDYKQQLYDLFASQNESARQAAINAIFQNLNSVKGTYKNQILSVMDEYDSLIDQNEVEKDRTRRRLKESQANRGQLNSGLGRQEALNLDIGYDNKNIDLKSARQKAITEIQNLIAQAEAEAYSQQANVENNYANALLQYKLANL